MFGYLVSSLQVIVLPLLFVCFARCERMCFRWISNGIFPGSVFVVCVFVVCVIVCESFDTLYYDCREEQYE